MWGRGPFGVWQSAPNVGHPALDLGAAVRFRTGLSLTCARSHICTVGVHYKAKFEFAAHRAIGIEAGLDPEAFDRLAAGENPGWFGDLELAHRYTATLLADHRVSSELHDEMVGSFELRRCRTGDHGWLCLICLTLNAFEVPLPKE